MKQLIATLQTQIDDMQETLNKLQKKITQASEFVAIDDLRQELNGFELKIHAIRKAFNQSLEETQ